MITCPELVVYDVASVEVSNKQASTHRWLDIRFKDKAGVILMDLTIYPEEGAAHPQVKVNEVG